MYFPFLWARCSNFLLLALNCLGWGCFYFNKGTLFKEDLHWRRLQPLPETHELETEGHHVLWTGRCQPTALFPLLNDPWLTLPATNFIKPSQVLPGICDCSDEIGAKIFLNGNSIWLWKECSRGFRVSMSNNHRPSKTYIYFAKFPWVGEQKRPRGPYSWPSPLKHSTGGMSPEPGCLAFYLAGGCALDCIFLRVCLKRRMTKGAREGWWSYYEKRKSKEVMISSNHGERMSRNVFPPNSLHSFGTECCVYFFLGAISNAGHLTESPVKLAKQCRYLADYKVGPLRLHSRMVLAEDSVIVKAQKKLSSHPIPSAFLPICGTAQPGQLCFLSHRSGWKLLG